MKKIVFLGLLIVFLAPVVWAQEKVEAPIWNVGDKWAFDREGPMEVIGCDARWYSVKFSEGIFSKDASGVAIFERKTLNIKYTLEKDRRKEYRGFRRKILNFPLTPGREWNDLYQQDESTGTTAQEMVQAEYREAFRVLGWSEIAVCAGKFKTIKLEYKMERFNRTLFGWTPMGESKAWYWYSPEAKFFVKCRYEKGYIERVYPRNNWELVSYELKK